MRIKNHKMKVAAKLEWQCPARMRKVRQQAPKRAARSAFSLQVPIRLRTQFERAYQ